MTSKMHRLHIPKVGEGVLNIPGGTPYEVDTIQQYDLGTYARFGRKGFVYAKAGGTIVPDIGAKQANSQKIGYVSVQAIALVNATEIAITSDVSCTKDELKGGEVVVFLAAEEKAFTRGIIGNDAMTATATLTLQLDSPIPVALDTNDHAEVIIDPYNGVTQTNNEWTPVMGMPVIGATDGQFLWLQVSGISWCAPEADVSAAVNTIEVCFKGQNGSLMVRDSANLGCQRAGMVIAPNTTGNGQGAPFIMLNIDH